MRALAVALTLLAPTIAAAASVGGYTLAMSNADAAKVGLAKLQAPGRLHRLRGEFRVCTKGVCQHARVRREIETAGADQGLRQLHQTSQIDDVYRDLKVPACPPKLDGTSPMLKASWRACHYPIGTLNVKSQLDAKPGKAAHYFAVEWLYEPGADKRFFAEEQDRKRRANALKNFQSGK